ncbi:hypothetical protein M0R01_04565 [bacterium]|nr:hypothetical protein [bacterium]
MIKKTWQEEFKDEFAMASDQSTILGAKGSSERIIDFISNLLKNQRAEILEDLNDKLPTYKTRDDKDFIVLNKSKINNMYCEGKVCGYNQCRKEILEALNKIK